MDLGKCLVSGQVFRFRSVGSAWVGIDGDNIYRLTASDGRVDVEGDPGAFARLFRLDHDYEAELAGLGLELVPHMERARGLRLLRPSCPREALFSFLCTSNNHISRITQMVGKLAAYGTVLASAPFQDPHDEPLGERDLGVRRFPSLERLAEVSEQELRERGFGYRARTIPLVARELLERGGERYLEETRQKPYQDVYDELILLPGVGPKLADCIALYAFDKTEAVPIDVHMWRAACPVYFPEWTGTDLTALKRQKLGDHLRTRFGALAGMAQQVLFFSSLTSGGRTV